MPRQTSRRRFLQQALAVGGGFWHFTHAPPKARASSLERLNIGVIGCGGKGRTDLKGCASENIVALCDVDEQRAAESFNAYPQANKYQDYRRMLDRETGLDAVIVSTPDHHHAPASVMAMRLGKHVYCQKPLTHSVHEARVMREVAAEMGVATQMGNQGHAFDGTRRAVELIRSGVIGKVREVHVWTDRPGKYWEQPLDRPTERPPVPGHLNWDLWLGPAPARPYHSTYVPHDWRAWWDFGTGALGDMGCHVMDAAFWALDLGAPLSVSAEVPGVHPESGPTWEIITYEYPARGDMPPVTLTWYDAGKAPPAELLDGEGMVGTGSLLIGDEGKMYLPDSYAQKMTLLPKEKFEGFEGPEPWLPRIGDPYQEWINACKGGAPALSQFSYSGVLTEAVLLGNVAVRAGQKIEWDADALRVTNLPEANRYIRRDYRPGWTI